MQVTGEIHALINPNIQVVYYPYIIDNKQESSLFKDNQGLQYKVWI